MSLHDAHLRRTPFELAFEDLPALDDLAGRVAEELAGRDADPEDAHALFTSNAVAAAVAGLAPEEAGPDALVRFGAIVYHAVHWTRADRPLYLLGTHAARYLVDGAPAGEAAPPRDAGYLQLPQHLFWTAAADGAPPESVDGIHWTATSAGLLHVMLSTGLRPDRPGFAVVPLPEAPLAEADAWLEADVRPEGADYASAMPGGELDGLYAFQSAGEVLKLLARFFAYVGRTPEALAEGSPGQDGEGPDASSLPFQRVELHA